jgi:hypothetical protein
MIKCFVMSFFVFFRVFICVSFIGYVFLVCVYIFFVCALSVCRFTIGIWQFFVVLFWNLPYRIGLLRYSRISLDRFRE